VGPNTESNSIGCPSKMFQSSVRINVGPNFPVRRPFLPPGRFQSSVRINVGPNLPSASLLEKHFKVSILRED